MYSTPLQHSSLSEAASTSIAQTHLHKSLELEPQLFRSSKAWGMEVGSSVGAPTEGLVEDLRFRAWDFRLWLAVLSGTGLGFVADFVVCRD